MLRLWHFFSCGEQGGAECAVSAGEETALPAAAAEGDSPNAAQAETDKAPHAEAATDASQPQDPEAGDFSPPDMSRLNIHMSELRRQEAQLRELIPGFDLERELRRSPRLLRLTAPGSPLSLAEALMTVHLPRLLEIREQRLVRQLREGYAKSLMSGSVPAPLPDSAFVPEAAPMDRQRLKERIRGGERIKP